MAEKKQHVSCIVDNREYEVEEGVYLKELSTELRNRIKADHPKVTPNDFICSHHLLRYRLASVDALINTDLKQSGKINRKLTKALQSDDYEVTDVNDKLLHSLTFGQKIADDVAVLVVVEVHHYFVCILVFWMVFNSCNCWHSF